MSTPAPDPALFEWMALRRVRDGGLSAGTDGYTQHGRPVTGDVASALNQLVRARCLALSRPGTEGRCTVCFTAAGQPRLADLEKALGGQ